jgi:hypothetical protein
MIQYITSTGQKTGRSKIVKKLQKKPMAIAFVAEYQNLNSGSLLTKGLNSSFSFDGRFEVPSSIPSSCSSDGSNFGDMNARKLLRR